MIFCPGTVIIIFLLKQIFVTLVHSVGLDSDHRNVSVRNRFLQHSDNNIMNTYFNVENHKKIEGKIWGQTSKNIPLYQRILLLFTLSDAQDVQ